MIVGADKKIERLRLNGKKINPKRRYQVVTIDYLADGNSELAALETAEKRVDTGLVLHELLIENIRRSQQQGKDVDSRVEGRIVYKYVGDR
jgi:2',3'-cyclic-nucleotide 2'-phosphodiesterase (5'-nucleotidase family)